jgi:hypothetical protein
VIGRSGAAEITKGKKSEAKQERAEKNFCFSKKEKKGLLDDGKKNNNRDYG